MYSCVLILEGDATQIKGRVLDIETSQLNWICHRLRDCQRSRWVCSVDVFQAQEKASVLMTEPIPVPRPFIWS